MTSNNNKVDTDSAEAPSKGVGCGALVRRARLKLPPQWEKCRTGMKGVRKWRNMTTGCWVTERDDDTETLYCGLSWEPLRLERAANTTQQAIDRIHAMSSPNTKVQPRGE